ncbi:MAG: hypothetical protein AAB263_11060, partial [Planctomycetota bacterium]
LEAKGNDTGTTGGTVKVLGEYVGLLSGTNVNASGDGGGGTVLVGGNFQGKGPEHNASAVWMGQGASINADAGSTGDGGKVIVWSENVSRVHGAISARGGSVSGNGGFVETSSHNQLEVGGLQLDLRAPNGQGGEWLIDPLNVTIVAGGANTTVTAAPNFAPTASGAQIGVDNINTQLGLGTSVTITTDSGNVLHQEPGDITQNAGATISKTLGLAASLSMTAAGTITLNGGITSSSNALNVTLTANDNSGTQADPTPLVGGVVVASAISTNGGTFTSSGLAFNNTGGTITTSGGNIQVNHTGTVTLGADLNAGAGTITGTAANVQVNAGGGSIQDGIDVIAGTGGTVNVGAGTFTEDLSITTNNLSLQGAGPTSVIKGVSSLSQASFPQFQNATNILVQADAVTINNFTLETPNVAAGSYSALITFVGQNFQVTNNTLNSIQGDTAPVGANDSLTNIMIQSIGPGAAPAGNIDGLLVQGNTFTGNGKGYYGVYLNQQGAAVAGTATIDNNQFNGNIWRAISTERSNTTITGNTIAPGPETLAAWGGSGIAVRNFTGTTIDNVTITGNTITTGGANGSFANELLLGFADTDPLTDIAISGNTADINVVGDVLGVT